MIEEQNDVIYVAEKLYREVNPESKMDVPSIIYEKAEAFKKEWLKTSSTLTLEQWIRLNKSRK